MRKLNECSPPRHRSEQLGKTETYGQQRDWPYERQKGDCPIDPRACGGILYPKQNVAAVDFYSRIRPDIPYGIMDDEASIFDTDANNFAPRFGFAWRPFGNTKTVVRAGYGISYYFKPLLNFARFVGQIPPNDIRASLTADPAVPQFNWDTLSQNILGGVNLAQAYETNTAVGRENLNPYIQQWSLSLSREIAPNTVVEAQYVGSKSTHTQISIDLELAPFGPGAPATRIPFSKFAQLAGYYYGGFGNYKWRDSELQAHSRDWTDVQCGLHLRQGNGRRRRLRARG